MTARQGVAQAIDHAALRLLVIAFVAAAAVIPGWLAQEPDARFLLAPSAAGAGQQRAAWGCLDPDTASAEDWRAVPGIGRKVATELVRVCLGTGTCRQAELAGIVKGVGPALAQRLRAVSCREPSLAAAEVRPGAPTRASPTRTRHAARGPPTP